MTATVRDSYIQSSSAGSYVLAWPSGTVAGDQVVIFVGAGYNALLPAGWDSIDQRDGANFNGAVYTKNLTAGDITAGSVTLNMGGGYNSVIAVVTFVGAVSFRAVAGSRNGSGSSSIALASTAAVQAGDTVMLFGSNRANSTDTVDFGSVLQTISASEASGCLYEYTPGGAGSFTANFNYTSGGAGNYQAILPVIDPLPPQPVIYQIAVVVVASETPPPAGGAQIQQLAAVVVAGPPKRRLGPLVG